MRRVASVKKFTGNANYGMGLIDRQVASKSVLNSITSNTKEFTDKAASFVSGVDASTGGHAGNILDSIKTAMDSSRVLSGILPDSAEFHQIKKTIDTPTANKMKDHAHAEATKRLSALYDMEEYAQAESLNVLGKEYNMAAMSDKKRKALNNKVKGQALSYRESVKQLEKGYIMQDQNFLEKTQTYFSNSEFGGKRKIAAGVAAAGLGIMNRYNNGGTLTRDEYGERDIVGLPFV